MLMKFCEMVIRENYAKYFVQPVIISQAECGYDGSGRRNAPPEVVHLTAKLILILLDVQKKRLEKGFYQGFLTNHIFGAY